MEITWGKVLLGVVGLVGTTVLTLLVTRLVNWLLERKSQLIVEVRVNEMFKAGKLANGIKDATREVLVSWEDREKLPLWSYDIYTRFFACEKYLKLSITNATLKKIVGLTLSVDTPGSELVQIGEDGELAVVQGGTALPLGDLQPKRKLIVSILTSGLFSTATELVLRERIVLSSDEHVRTRYLFPSPDHIAFSDKIRRFARLTILWIVLGVCLMIGFSMFANKA